MHHATGNYSSQAGLLMAAAGIEPSFHSLSNVGDAHARARNFTGAIEAYTKAVMLAQTSGGDAAAAPVRRMLASALMAAGRDRAAVDELTTALEHATGADAASLHAQLGELLGGPTLRRWEEARRHLDDAMVGTKAPRELVDDALSLIDNGRKEGHEWEEREAAIDRADDDGVRSDFTCRLPLRVPSLFAHAPTPTRPPTDLVIHELGYR